ncbi:FKBP-type peptidyl-prolyl cis-trans isomerase, partial [Enterobacter asburiae]|uniref:FKBP-type peptidyl-prolyl cis-trans isomerase n=1 Tax=Enterobacter asburiae TaxID=61645 RepID=UPI003F55CF56
PHEGSGHARRLLPVAAALVFAGAVGATHAGPSPASGDASDAQKSQLLQQLDAQQRDLDALRARVLAGDADKASAPARGSEPAGHPLPTAPATVAPAPAGLTGTSVAPAAERKPGASPAPVATPGTAPVPDPEPAAASPAVPVTAQSVAPGTVSLTTTAQRQAYASGVTVWRQIAASLDAQKAAGIELDPQLLLAGMQDMAGGRPLRMTRDAIDTVMTTLNQQVHEQGESARAQAESEGRAYRLAFSRQKGVKSDAGAWYQVLSPGAGKRLKTSDTVVLSVTGSLPDGSTFDPSGQNGQTKTARVSALLPAVAIGLQKVSPGGHVKIVVPPEKGYGEAGLPPAIPGGATLIFDIQVLSLAG